jgi:hypothetical protein
MSLFIVALDSFGASGCVLDHATSSGREALSSFSGDFFGSETARFAHLVRSKTVLCEFDYSVARLPNCMVNLPLTAITRKHVRQFREALQQLPKRRAARSQHSRANPSN